MLQMYDPKREYGAHKASIDRAIQTVLDHGIFINGPEVKTLEQNLSKYTDAKCVSVSNGTDALKVALLALGVSKDDEVITVAHSWISTVEVISVINAIPVFVDIDEKTFNIDPKKIEAKITEKTKAIVAVSLYGQMANFDAINEIADKYNLPVVEDGAQSFGAESKCGSKSGSVTTIGATSFFPSKPLGCYGDGGACFTRNSELEEKIRAIKNHGGVKRFRHKYVGLNARLDTLQAAILCEKIQYYEETVKNRIRCADYYTENLGFAVGQGYTLPHVLDGYKSVWAQYSILAPDTDTRDKIVGHLKNNNVNVAIFYPAPLHLQECFSYLNYKEGDLPVTEDVCRRIFNLPCYAELTRDEQDLVIKLIRDFIC